MIFNSKTGLIVGWISCVLISGCQRPGQMRGSEGDYYKPETSPSYYSRGGAKSPTQRVEQMGQPRKRVMVLNFWNDTPVPMSDLGSFAADELKRGLFLTQRMVLPTDLKLEHHTEDFVQGEKVKVSQLIREGRKLGVAVLGIGRISKVVFRQRGDEVGLFRQKQSLAAVDVEMKLFDVSGGKEIFAGAKSGDAAVNAVVTFDAKGTESSEYRAELVKSASRNAVAQLVPEVVRAVEKLAWEGRVAKVAGSKVYINSGRASGLIGGDILRVMGPGDDIYDPTNGAYLGRTQGQLKGTLEVIDFIGTDGAVSEIHTGGNFQEGDSVQLY